MASDRSTGSILDRLHRLLVERKSADPDSSYVASLYAKGLDAILKKLGEEAAETLLAAKNADRAALVHELADLWFHCLVLMAQQGIEPAQIARELERRMGRSGLEEKAARPRS